MNKIIWEQNLGQLLYQLDTDKKKQVGKQNHKKGKVHFL